MLGEISNKHIKKVTVSQMMVRFREKNKIGKRVGSGGSAGVGRKGLLTRGISLKE